MGDGENAPLRLQSNPKVRLEFHGSTITSDAGLLAFREFDDALGLTEIAEDYLQESRTGRNILHHLVPLLRQSIFSRLAGYDDTNDAVRLSQDPAMRVIVGWQGSERKGASTSEMGRFETEFLTQEDNLKGVARINTQWVERAMAHTLHRRVILDMDSSESPVHGQQEGAAYNGHFECVCYHPLFLFNQFGDCEAAKLRSGNVHSADDWQEVLDPVVERYLTAAVRLLFRADAAFAKPEIYDYLEARNIGYAIRLRSNQVLQREIAHRLIRPTEWLSPKPIVSYHDFVYQAQSWNVARRVVSKVEWHQGELFPRVGFIVANLSYPNIGIVRFYNGRGTAEQWIKEGKSTRIRPMTTSQNPNARKSNLPNQPQHALRHVKSQNPRPLPQSRKHPRSQSESALPPRNGRNVVGHAPLRNAASSKSMAYAETASNLPYQGKPVAQIPAAAWVWAGNGAWAAQALRDVHISNAPVHHYTQAPDAGSHLGTKIRRRLS